MNEKELQPNPKTILEEAYELTNNEWKEITVYDLNRALMYRYYNQQKEAHDWKLFEAKPMKKGEPIKANRQAEVIHLLELVKRIEEENFIECCEFLEKEKPNPNNNVQPLYIPNTNEEDSPLLMIQLDSNMEMVIKEKTFLYKPS